MVKVAKKKTVSKKVIKKAAKRPAKKTVIFVECDCGFNNHLFIRGEGAGLSWHHGQQLINNKSDEWVFEIAHVEPCIEFKILLNDQVFEIGENHKVKKGQKYQVKPKFH